jgi:hypothetical protein
MKKKTGRKIERIIIDEGTEMSDENLNDLSKLMEEAQKSGKGKIYTSSTEPYYMGVDLSKGKGTGVVAHKEKGVLVIDEIVEI